MTVKLFRVRAEGTRIHKKGVQSVATRVKCIREKKCQWRGKIDETICSFFQLVYSLNTGRDYGTILCWAENSLGIQAEPCVFHLIPAGKCILLQQQHPAG